MKSLGSGSPNAYQAEDKTTKHDIELQPVIIEKKWVVGDHGSPAAKKDDLSRGSKDKLTLWRGIEPRSRA